MPLYAIVRNLGASTAAEQDAMVYRSVACARAYPGLRWYRSYVDREANATVCFYSALSHSDIVDHSALARVPCDEVFEVVEMVPETGSPSVGGSSLYLVRRRFAMAATRESFFEDARMWAPVDAASDSGLLWDRSFWADTEKQAWCIVQAPGGVEIVDRIAEMKTGCDEIHPVELAVPDDFAGFFDEVEHLSDEDWRRGLAVAFESAPEVVHPLRSFV